jgi:kinetochore protein NDC80
MYFRSPDSAAIARKNARIETDLEEQKAEVAKLKAELEKLQSTPVCPYNLFPKIRRLTFSKAPIEKLLTDNKFLKRDREKFQECIRSWEGRKKTLISHIINLKADIVQQSERIIGRALCKTDSFVN